MIDIVKRAVEFLTFPTNLFWIMVGLYFVSGFKKYKHRNKFLFVALIWVLLTGTRWVPDLMVYGLEKQYDAFIIDDEIRNDSVFIHVLGGGGCYDPDLPEQERLSQTSLARMSEGIRIYSKMPYSKLIFSGYSSTNNITQAALTKEAAIAMGVSVDDIEILETPSTTEEEAMSYKSTYGNSNSTLILVTSDIHMPRAMFLFKKHGLHPIAAPSDHILKHLYLKDNTSKSEVKRGYWWRSERSNFEKFYTSMHEYIGLVWAKI